jgi:hypothetical protein
MELFPKTHLQLQGVREPSPWTAQREYAHPFGFQSQRSQSYFELVQDNSLTIKRSVVDYRTRLI